MRKLFATHPNIDIQSTLVLMNKGAFPMSGLENFTKKKYTGSKIIEWYDAKDYQAIESYIKNEADSFIELYGALVKELPELGIKILRELGIVKN